MIPSGTRSRDGQRLTADELAAWRGLLRIAFSIRQDLGQQLHEEHGLSMAEYDLLVRLAERPDRKMRMSELAEAILQPRSSVTRIAAGLEARRFIRREPTTSDGRGTEAVLTASGEAAFRKAQKTHLAGVRERFLERLTDRQLDELARAWSAIDPGALAPGPDEDV
jgi:DNA-binding MarR family transcriptional regulator